MITSTFVVGTSRVEVVLNRASLPQTAHPLGYVSFTGTSPAIGSGQIVDSLRDSTQDARIARLCELWDDWHMKDDDPAVDEAERILAELDGTRIDVDAPAELDVATFSNSNNTIDSRDVIARIEELRNWLDAYPFADAVEDVCTELKVLEALEDEASGYASDWRHGETLIADSYFEDYARELAEDIGAIQRDANWPNNHIDWAAAAEALKQDYTEVDFDGTAYWIR